MKAVLLLLLASVAWGKEGYVIFPSKPSLLPPSPSKATPPPPSCKLDTDCPRSYCMNQPPHVPPFHCQSTPSLVCPDWPIANLTCLHGGSKFPKGCEVNSDCPEGYCLSSPPHKPPFVCQSFVNPICACDCVSNWEGPTCNVWNNTNTPSNTNKIINYLNTLAAKQRSAMADSAYLNPLSGSAGYGVDMSTGHVGQPVVMLTYQDANKTFDGHRLPVQSKFTPFVAAGSSGPPPASHISVSNHAFTGVAGYRSMVQGFVSGAETSAQPVVGMSALGSSTMQDVWHEYFSDDFSLGLSQQLFPTYEMTVASTALDEHVFLALDSLPPSYASDTDQAAYQEFFRLWGTHYATTVVSGGALEAVSKWDYAIYRHDGMSTESIAAQVALDRSLLTGLSDAGSPNASPPTLNPTYSATRQRDPLHCYGGNPEDCSAAQMSNWLNSLVSGAAPLTVQLAPIADLIADTDTKAAFSAAAAAYQTAQTDAWSSFSSCPSCEWGTCAGNAEACTCAGNSYDRTCDVCLKGYGGSDCNTPICSQGCSATSGHCTAPNTCTCDSCYAGPSCMEYTCGCLGGDHTVLTADNRTLPLTDVSVGDRVQAVAADGSVVWSDVYYVRTGGDAAPKELTQVTVEGGVTLRLTHDHLVYVEPKWRTNAAVAPSPATERMAADVAVGEYLWVRASAMAPDTFKLARVEAVDSIVSSAPVVTVHTLAGPVVVDGVLASSYEFSSTLRWWENLEDMLVYKFFPRVAASPGFAAYADAWDAYVGNPLHWACRAVWQAVQVLPSPAALFFASSPSV